MSETIDIHEKLDVLFLKVLTEIVEMGKDKSYRKILDPNGDYEYDDLKRFIEQSLKRQLISEGLIEDESNEDWDSHDSSPPVTPSLVDSKRGLHYLEPRD